ncbi:MAG: hypothetical protein LIQ31_13415 [Planctomycetes bacterium]|nr:hypothetical protein [Planctomycetota bacterium]
MEIVLAAEVAEASSRDTGGYWQLALILAAIGLLGLISRWRKANAPVVETAKEIRSRDTNPNRYRDAADRAIVELLETSRTLHAEVDTKIRVLNRLVREAEEQSARLERLVALAEKRESVPGMVAAEHEDTVVIPPQPVAAPARPDGAAGGKPAFLSELHERVYMLNRDGKHVQEIAKATNLSTTEVGFIVRNLPGERGGGEK